jgi:hypothetical protein
MLFIRRAAVTAAAAPQASPGETQFVDKHRCVIGHFLALRTDMTVAILL